MGLVWRDVLISPLSFFVILVSRKFTSVSLMVKENFILGWYSFIASVKDDSSSRECGQMKNISSINLHQTVGFNTLVCKNFCSRLSMKIIEKFGTIIVPMLVPIDCTYNSLLNLKQFFVK